MNVVPRCPTAPVKCLCAKEQKEIQEAALEAPAGAMQRVLMGPAWFLSRCLSQSRQFVGFRLPPKKHDKQAATRIHAQTLQAWHVSGSLGSVSVDLHSLTCLWQEQREQHEGMLEDG